MALQFGENSVANPLFVNTAAPPVGAAATQVQGTAADGAAPVGNPVLVAGLDTAGNVEVLDLATPGAAVPGNAIQITGSDNTNAQVPTVIAEAAALTRANSKPIMTGFSDGVNARVMGGDTQGDLYTNVRYNGAIAGGQVGNALAVGAHNSGASDGTNLQYMTVASAAIQSAAVTGNKAHVVTGPGLITTVHQPVAATQASASRVAIAATRHVCRKVTINLEGVAAQGDIIFNLRDGATGAGTVLWTVRFGLAVGNTFAQVFDLGDIPGSVNTAMTLESAAAPAGTNFASVVMETYDAT